MYAIIGAGTGLSVYLSIIVARQYAPFLAGLAIVTYVLGLRHGVDADHIVAIDNTVRKLLHEDQKPYSVGLWFSLGHSTVVVGLILALILATRSVVGALPALQSSGAIIGTVVSGVFLWLMALVNVVIVVGIFKIWKGMKKGDLDQEGLDNLLENRGFLNRYFRPLFRIVKKPWQIYPIGCLFGLGFDTASEIALLGISVGVGLSSAVPFWTIIILPLTFTCGMVLVDASDGVFMRVAYGWAFLNPLRKIYYNLTVTLISILVAVVIGTLELLSVLANELKLSGPFWTSLGRLNFESIGYGIIGIFLSAWIVSLAYWKYKRFDELTPIRTREH
jgi:nickel/cobalt transporter (NiCoT) family protein